MSQRDRYELGKWFYSRKESTRILEYIKQNQDKGITKQDVANFMHKAEISSRPTTLKAIQSMLDFGVILDDKKRKNARSRLIINPEFDFKTMEQDLLIWVLAGFRAYFKFLDDDESKGVNTQLIPNLIEMVDDFGTRLTVTKHEEKKKTKTK